MIEPVIDEASSKVVKRQRMRRAKALGAIGWFVLLGGAALIGAKDTWAEYGLALWVGGLILMATAVNDLIRLSRTPTKHPDYWEKDFPA